MVKSSKNSISKITKKTSDLSKQSKHSKQFKQSQVKASPKSNNTPIFKINNSNLQVKHSKPIQTLSPPNEPNYPRSQRLKTDLHKLAVTANSKSQEDPQKNLLCILKKLKQEYYNKTPQFSSPSLKTIHNPVMLINNKTLGPINHFLKPDGVVNLDLIIPNKPKYTPESVAKHVQQELLNKQRNRFEQMCRRKTDSVASSIANNSHTPSTTKSITTSRLTVSPTYDAFRSKHLSSTNKIQIISPPHKKQSVTATAPPHYESVSSFKKSLPVCIQHARVLTTQEEIKALRAKADEAIRFHKTFTVCGNFNSIRRSLLSRGWVEKLLSNYLPPACDPNLIKRLQYQSIPELILGVKDKELGHVYRQLILSKMIANHPVAFYWNMNRGTYKNNTENFKNTLINYIAKNRFNYANKQGLCQCSEDAYWFNNPGVSYLRTPRSYTIANNVVPEEFCMDFKLSAAMSLFKWIIHVHENNTSRLISKCGKVPISNFHFAMVECTKFIQRVKHEDIDTEIPKASARDWDDFLDYFYKAVHVGNHFKQTNLETEVSIVHKSKGMLKKLCEHWPYLQMDGFMNIWILKPSYGSRGIGIHFCRTLQYVVKITAEHKSYSYVVQKYIERPLLIFNTKFDIRQWFLISAIKPLTIWIYDECYLRFSSQTYNLRKLHESIHLTNNSVQSKYHNCNRDPGLPFHNMWYLRDFKQHLSNIGYPDVFDQIIFPGMKECIVAAILSTQDEMYPNNKAFELHGADFMITEDFKPWLLEINSSPALMPTTPVTAKLCPMVLEDLIKVVIDRARNPKAPTGSFQLMYKAKQEALPKLDSHLVLEGTPLSASYFIAPQEEDTRVPAPSVIHNPDSKKDLVKTCDYMRAIGQDMQNTLKNLLKLIDDEKRRRIKHTELKIDESKKDVLSASVYSDQLNRIKGDVREIEEIFKKKKYSAPTASQDCVMKMSSNNGMIMDSKVSCRRVSNGSIKGSTLKHVPSSTGSSASDISSVLNLVQNFD